MKETINALCVFLENLLDTIGPYSSGVWSAILKLIVGTVLGFAFVGFFCGCVYIFTPLYDSLVDAHVWGNASAWICIILGFLIFCALVLVWTFIEDFIKNHANSYRKKVEEEYIEETKRKRRYRRDVNKYNRLLEERNKINASMCKTF